MSGRFRPLKRFGQNFLIDRNIIGKIIADVRVSRMDFVLEIGPGLGAMTFPLARRAGRFIAIEVDRGLCSDLAHEAAGFKNAQIVCADILEFDLKKFAKANKIKAFKVVANLPYYITTPILEYLFKNIGLIDDIFITVQKEVAQRMVAQPGAQSYGSLSCFVNYFSSPSIEFAIKKGSFRPVPKVDSCFVRLKPRRSSAKHFCVRSEDLFFKVIRSAFGQRRKKLYTSLSCVLPRRDLLGLSCQDLLARRPQELTLEDFSRLSNLIFEKTTP